MDAFSVKMISEYNFYIKLSLILKAFFRCGISVGLLCVFPFLQNSADFPCGIIGFYVLSNE